MPFATVVPAWYETIKEEIQSSEELERKLQDYTDEKLNDD